MLDARLLHLRERDARRRGQAVVGAGDEYLDGDDLEAGEYDDDADDEDGDEVAEEVRLSDIRDLAEYERVKTHIKTFDDIVGGGLVFGFVYGLAGDGGVGKSTFCLQLARALRLETRYSTGEESIDDIALRARRAKIPKSNIVVVKTDDITQALPLPEDDDDDDRDDDDDDDADADDAAPQREFDLCIIDSVQKYRHPDYRGRPGGNEQIVRVAKYISETTKALGCITIALSRVNSEGRAAGPHDFTHDVDCMMWLKFAAFLADGDADSEDPRRIFQIPKKNRGGRTPRQIGCTMTEKGLVFG